MYMYLYLYYIENKEYVYVPVSVSYSFMNISGHCEDFSRAIHAPVHQSNGIHTHGHTLY